MGPWPLARCHCHGNHSGVILLRCAVGPHLASRDQRHIEAGRLGRSKVEGPGPPFPPIALWGAGDLRSLDRCRARRKEAQGGEVPGSMTTGDGRVLEPVRVRVGLQHDPLDGTDARHDTEVALLDHRGVIVAVNGAWVAFAAANGGDPARAGIGRSYLDACEDAAGDPQADQVGAAIRWALAGRLESPFRCTASCDSDEWLRWFEVNVSARRDRDGSGTGAVVALRPLTTARRLGGDGPGGGRHKIFTWRR